MSLLLPKQHICLNIDKRQRLSSAILQICCPAALTFDSSSIFRFLNFPEGHTAVSLQSSCSWAAAQCSSWAVLQLESAAAAAISSQLRARQNTAAALSPGDTTRIRHPKFCNTEEVL